MKLIDLARRGLQKLQSSINGKSRLIKRVRAAKAVRDASPHVYTDNPKLSLIILSFNHKANVRRILDNLRLTNADELIVCEDGSIDGSDRVWLRHLTRPNDFLIRSNDIHEIRSYNRAAHLAAGEFICILQDDDIPPADSGWIQQALSLFDLYPKLAILGAYQAWLLDFAGPTDSVARKVYGQWETEIPYQDPTLGIPFMFAEGVSIGPIFYRRDVLFALGGFDLHFSRPGELGILSDHDLCLKAWLAGWQVGLFGPAVFERCVGGQGTLMFGPSERQRNLKMNLQRIKHIYASRIDAIEKIWSGLNQNLRVKF